MKIKFICSGNTCRSPMAQALAARLAQQRGLQDVTFSSAGLTAFAGDEASPNAVEAMREVGIDLSAHRARTLTNVDLTDTDCFAVMSATHQSMLMQVGVEPEKIVLLGGGIPDPYGRSVEEYRRCRDRLEQAVGALLDRIESGRAAGGQTDDAGD